jgi:hypothetical protein
MNAMGIDPKGVDRSPRNRPAAVTRRLPMPMTDADKLKRERAKWRKLRVWARKRVILNPRYASGVGADVALIAEMTRLSRNAVK